MWFSGCGSRVQSESTKTKIKPFKWKALNKTYQKKKNKTYQKKKKETKQAEEEEDEEAMKKGVKAGEIVTATAAILYQCPPPPVFGRYKPIWLELVQIGLIWRQSACIVKKKKWTRFNAQAAASLAHRHVRRECGGHFATSVHPSLLTHLLHQ